MPGSALWESASPNLPLILKTTAISRGLSSSPGAKALACLLGEYFCEAPKRYPHIPLQILKCKAPPTTPFSGAWTTGSYDGWPQWNQDRSEIFVRICPALGNLPTPEARKKLLEIEKQHGRRQSWYGRNSANRHWPAPWNISQPWPR